MPNTYFMERLIHSIKIALTCLIGFALTSEVSFTRGPWLVISIIVVMCAQISIGSMIQKSTMRFLGTIGGSIVAALSIYLFPSDYYIFAITTAVTVAIFSFIATSESKYHDAGTLGAVTVAIILIGHNPTVEVAWDRFIEISLGILLAGFISQILFPVHAATRLRDDQAKTLRQLRDYYFATMLTEQFDKNVSNYLELDESIVRSLIAQRKLANDAGRELFGPGFDVGKFNEYLWFAREVLRSMTFMHQACHASPHCQKLFTGMMVVSDFQDEICKALDDIANRIEIRPVTAITIPSILPMKAAIASDGFVLSADDLLYCHAYLFCAEILCKNLQQLSNLVSGEALNQFR